MGTLAFERGVSTLGQNLMFLNEWDEVLAVARRNGRADDPVVRQRLADCWGRLRIMRLNALRMLSSSQDTPQAAMVAKLLVSTLHRDPRGRGTVVLGPEYTPR